MSENEKMYSVKDIIGFLNVSKNKVYELINSGELKAMQIGKPWRIKKVDYDAFINLKRKLNNNIIGGLQDDRESDN